MSQSESPSAAGPRIDTGPLGVRFNASLLAQKRAASRHLIPSQITVEVLKTYHLMHEMTGKRWVTSRDVSRTGISFHSFEPMYFGELIRIELRLDRGKIRPLDAEVVRCRCLGNGTFEVGARFREQQGAPVLPEPKRPEIPDIPWILR